MQCRNARCLMLAIAILALVLPRIADASTGTHEAPLRSLPCPYPISAMRLHTAGNRLLDSANHTVVLHGVDLPSMEWSNRGDHVRRSLAVAIKQWRIQIVRIPTADARWFGQAPGQKHGGRVYRHILDQLIATAAKNHVYVVFDLHWTDMNGNVAQLGQHRMPGPGSIAFWRSVGRRYKHFPNVFFDVYNEPHGIPWPLWLNGGPSAGETKTSVITYHATGMQQLYNTIRRAGAKNIVIIGGLKWAYDDFGIPHGYAVKGFNIVYDCHIYPWKHKWQHSFKQASDSVPMIIDEFGGGAANVPFGKKVLAFAARHHISWCAWCFHPKAGPVLIKNWNYQPSTFGRLIRSALGGGK